MTRLRGGGDVDHSVNSGNSASARLFHLVRPTDPDPTAAERNGKLMAEIYLTRLLTAKGTLQKFLEVKGWGLKSTLNFTDKTDKKQESKNGFINYRLFLLSQH